MQRVFTLSGCKQNNSKATAQIVTKFEMLYNKVKMLSRFNFGTSNGEIKRIMNFVAACCSPLEAPFKHLLQISQECDVVVWVSLLQSVAQLFTSLQTMPDRSLSP